MSDAPVTTISRDLIRQCVQCGMCLTACPTFRLTGSEPDSPRGRIFQMDLVRKGEVAPDDPDFQQHIDFCLGCRACESACPSGVQYGQLFEQARAVSPARAPITVKGLRWLIGRRWGQRVFGQLTRLYQKTGVQWLAQRTGILRLAPHSLREADAVLAPLEGGLFVGRLPALVPAVGQRRYRVAFLEGCVMAEFMPRTNRDTVEVLALNGCEVLVPRGQGCCGALHLHGGEKEQARELARRNIEVFEGFEVDAILSNSAGCGAALKEYGHLFDDPEWRDRARTFAARVRDVQEFLSEVGLSLEPGPLDLTITYQDACHLAHGQRVREQPRELLLSIPGLELVEMPGSDSCCGSAGTYNLQQHAASMQLLDEKLAAIGSTGATVVAAANPGCLMQIAAGARRRGLPLSAVHPMSLLARAYRQAGR
ncbi:MAG: (Fe-S)-binding protein [Dehalococcoidia bacterium]